MKEIFYWMPVFMFLVTNSCFLCRGRKLFIRNKVYICTAMTDTIKIFIVLMLLTGVSFTAAAREADLAEVRVMQQGPEKTEHHELGGSTWAARFRWIWTGN